LLRLDLAALLVNQPVDSFQLFALYFLELLLVLLVIEFFFHVLGLQDLIDFFLIFLRFFFIFALVLLFIFFFQSLGLFDKPILAYPVEQCLCDRTGFALSTLATGVSIRVEGACTFKRVRIIFSVLGQLSAGRQVSTGTMCKRLLDV